MSGEVGAKGEKMGASGSEAGMGLLPLSVVSPRPGANLTLRPRPSHTTRPWASAALHVEPRPQLRTVLRPQPCCPRGVSTAWFPARVAA